MKLSRSGDSAASHKRGVPSDPDAPAVAADTAGGLSVLFTILCIVDLFGVFPVISLPNSVIACGLYGIPLVLIVFTLQMYTAMLLGRSWLLAKAISPHIQEKNRSPYAAVAELTFGKGMGGLVTFFIDSTVFAASVPNFIVASQSMQLFWWKITGGDVAVSYCLWMVVIGLLLCPVMWLGSPKDMKPLALISVLIVVTVAVSTWSCILRDTVSPPSAGDLLHYKPQIQDLITAYGIIAFQFDIHPMLLTIQVDMKDSRRVNAAVAGGFAVTCAIFAVTCALAGYRYGANVTPNILWGIPPSFPLYMVALLVTLQLCLSNAVGNSALFQHIEDLLRIPRVFCLKRCLIRSGIVALAVFLGEAIPKFEVIMGLVGSTLTGPLMFIFPPLFFLKLCYMKLRHQEENDETQDGTSKVPLVRHTDALNVNYRTFSDNDRLICDDGPEQGVKWYELMLAIIVVIVGVTATITAIYSSWTDFIHSFDFSTPCLVNATAAARVFIYSSI